jgi:hypothetical protein
MTADDGNLSIDFLVGFTVFLLAFIWVVSMIPGLLIGLQSYTIDYDAVAYRTGVILAEDPGWPASPPWESDRFKDQKAEVIRFGLAISRDTPNILSQDKVNRFFCTTAFSYPEDYHQRAIFGDFPYRFRISLVDMDEFRTQTVGERLPPGYGAIRRVVKIKGGSSAYINASSYKNTENASTHVFTIEINNTYLLTNITNLAYQIDPAREQLVINIANLRSTCPVPLTTLTLKNIKIYKLDAGLYSNVPLPASNNPYIDGSSTRLSSAWPAAPAPVTDNVTLRFSPDFFDQMKAQNSQIFIAMGFDVAPDCTFLNNTQVLDSAGLPTNYDNLDGVFTYYNPATKEKNMNTTPFDYNYDPGKVTQPVLRDAILQVAVWSGETGIDPTVPLFSDNFDAVTAPDGYTEVGIVERWTASPHSGVSSVILRDQPSSMERTISTAGYSDITVSFEMGSKINNNPGRYFIAEWSPDGGTTWNTLKRINYGDPENDDNLHPFSYSLPASADNNANFVLRFVLNVAVPGEKGYVDNIVVGGIPN